MDPHSRLAHNSTICRACDGWSLFLRAKPFWRRLAIAGRCTPRRRARTTEASRIARPQHGAYPCILGVPRMRLTARWALQRNGHARKTLEQNPLAAQTRRNRRARARALNEYVSHLRSLGERTNVRRSVASAHLRRVQHCLGHARAPRIWARSAVRNFPLIRFEGAERVQHIFKAVDNSRRLRPALHTPAQS